MILSAAASATETLYQKFDSCGGKNDISTSYWFFAYIDNTLAQEFHNFIGDMDQFALFYLQLVIRLKRSVNEETGSVSDLHAYLGNEDNVNHPFIQTQLLLVTVYQMITLISEDNKRQFDMFIWK